MPAMPMATLCNVDIWCEETKRPKNPPNVGLLQGWHVVHFVPSDSNEVASPLVALHYEQLLLGTRPGEGDLLVGGDHLVQLLLLPGGHHVAGDAGGGLLGLCGQGRALVVDHRLRGDDPHLQKDHEEDVEKVPSSDLLRDCLHCDGMVASHHDDLIMKRRNFSHVKDSTLVPAGNF